MTIQERTPITPDDVVQIRGKYMYVGDQRFFVKGIAFPTPPPTQKRHTGIGLDLEAKQEYQPDLSGWLAVLEQLAEETDINAVRVYEMDCAYDYGEFLTRAADLGIYVLVPLTSVSGDGVLPRDKSAPSCYPDKLYHYGIRCIQQYWHHPNVLAGVIGNEVFNDLTAWQAAPCVKAYLNDMLDFSNARAAILLRDSRKSTRSSFPLLYATQHDSPNAEILPDEAIKLTLDYLSCGIGGHENFIFGINVESWCSSLQTFEFEEDGITESSYHSLWRTLSCHNKSVVQIDAVTGAKTFLQQSPLSTVPVTVPVIFSEMGCSKDLFNRENSVEPKKARDWKQIPLVLPGGAMSDQLSGFVAYAYDGDPLFRIMEGKWDGQHTLPPSLDFELFKEELEYAGHGEGKNSAGHSMLVGRSRSDATEKQPGPSSCSDSVSLLQKSLGVHLIDLSDMPSRFDPKDLVQTSPSSMRNASSLPLTTAEVLQSPSTKISTWKFVKGHNIVPQTSGPWLSGTLLVFSFLAVVAIWTSRKLVRRKFFLVDEDASMQGLSSKHEEEVKVKQFYGSISV